VIKFNLTNKRVEEDRIQNVEAIKSAHAWQMIEQPEWERRGERGRNEER